MESFKNLVPQVWTQQIVFSRLVFNCQQSATFLVFHWLIVYGRVTLKLVVTHMVSEQPHAWPTTVCVPLSSQWHLHSDGRNLLYVYHSSHRLSTFACPRAFAFAGPTAQNSLPDIIWNPNVIDAVFGHLSRMFVYVEVLPNAPVQTVPVYRFRFSLYYYFSSFTFAFNNCNIHLYSTHGHRYHKQTNSTQTDVTKSIGL